MAKHNFWRKYHKWVGLVFSVFLLVFCFSGVVMNHRMAFRHCEVPRSWLPSEYHISNWNNGIVKNTFAINDDSLLIYGNSGIWLQTNDTIVDFNAGLEQGVDCRKISNIIFDADSTMWCAAQFDLCHFDGNKWTPVDLPGNNERVVDVISHGDTIAAMTRSALYIGNANNFERHELPAPEGYEPKVTLFKTFWELHCGALFGTVGKVVVDCIAVVIVILCITGFRQFILPKRIKRENASGNKDRAKQLAMRLRTNFSLHNNLGKWLIPLTLIVAITGMCLRPPFMVPLVLTSTKPLPGSALDSDNAFDDKLRAIRYDSLRSNFLVSTSMGFYTLESLRAVPVKTTSDAPVSPMGVNVFEPEGSEWLIGSFSGLFRWDPSNGSVRDYFTGEEYKAPVGRPVGTTIVSGFSRHLGNVIFEYDKGTNNIGAMPDIIANQPMSLWNFALELHVGRVYTFLGPISVLFVFISGLLLTLILISGFILRRK